MQTPALTELKEWRKSFVSEDESDRMIGEWIRQKSEAERRRNEIDGLLIALGDRLEKLGRALQSKDLSIDSLRELLHFGPQSGITVDGIESFLQERDRLEITVRDCGIQIRNLGVI